MNRETVLYPVSWPKGQWPVADRVRGKMSGPLPPKNLNVPGTGRFVKDPDYYTFPRGSLLPRHFTFWRFPHKKNYAISPPGHANCLRLTPSNANLTSFATFDPPAGQTFIGRRQVDTLFTYSVDLEFSPSKQGEEAGVTIFLSQERHGDLGVVYTNEAPHLRFRAEGPGAPATILKSMPAAWCETGVHLEIKAINFTHYSLSAGAKGWSVERVALLDNALLSTSFTGAFVGAYATTNGHGEGGTPAYFANWVYQGQGQAIDDGEYYPSNGQKGTPTPSQ
ncbi:hypothetical protein LTR53_016578 [Teratosphaeriaceae sp. CCFEE 6253]|nr:hypothetical protein LTR53_016578 [Teratosphaeriaceae sp. CCFEE 6253]